MAFYLQCGSGGCTQDLLSAQGLSYIPSLLSFLKDYFERSFFFLKFPRPALTMNEANLGTPRTSIAFWG